MFADSHPHGSRTSGLQLRRLPVTEYDDRDKKMISKGPLKLNGREHGDIQTSCGGPRACCAPLTARMIRHAATSTLRAMNVARAGTDKPLPVLERDIGMTLDTSTLRALSGVSLPVSIVPLYLYPLSQYRLYRVLAPIAEGGPSRWWALESLERIGRIRDREA